MKITAVIVTYNRLALLQRLIASLRTQTRSLDNIIVVNNSSTDGTGKWLATQGDLEVVTQPNVGGAGGFHTGIDRAYADGYDKLWCMDDDVWPEPDCLERLLRCDGDGIGILCPTRYQNGKLFITEIERFNLTNPFRSLHCHAITLQQVESREWNSIEGMAFEGPLIDRRVVDSIGLPNKDYYLLYDDSDYSYRTTLAGYSVRLVTVARLNKELFFSDKTREQAVAAAKWKLKYHIRNTCHFNRTYGKNWLVRHLRPIAVLLEYVVYVLKNAPFNSKYECGDLRVFYKAYRDGVRGVLGK